MRLRRWFLMHTLAPMDRRAERRFMRTGELKRPYEVRIEALLWLIVGRLSSARLHWMTARRMSA